MYAYRTSIVRALRLLSHARVLLRSFVRHTYYSLMSPTYDGTVQKRPNGYDRFKIILYRTENISKPALIIADPTDQQDQSTLFDRHALHTVYHDPETRTQHNR